MENVRNRRICQFIAAAVVLAISIWGMVSG